MNILVSNDDGIFTQGLKILVRELSNIGEVYVVAPDRQHSGAGQGITMNEEMILKPYKIEYSKEAYSMSGRPADCVKMGLELFKSKGIEIDLVVSGINYGGNLGTDVLYSGTVGAAREALMSKVMSVAISLDDHSGGDFDFVAYKSRQIIEKIKIEDMKKPTYMLNVNFPNIAKGDIKGFKTLKLGIREYGKWFDKQPIGDDEYKVVYGGEIVRQYVDDDSLIETDVQAVDNGYVAITPLDFDTINYEKLKEIGANYDKQTI